MRISTRLRYGLRLLLELARHEGGKPVKLKDVSANQQIPLPYLRQLIIPLENEGLVKSVRGSRGGYLLAQPPEKIGLLKVARVLEGPLTLVNCVGEPSACNRSPSCPTRKLWEEISEETRKVLSQKTLKSLLDEGQTQA
ncbi:MAG: hypothetical protein PWP04_745 [Candidatus Atribacteria bacterium]|nr:hypothetical protein [Candidatus Atribacteria bacterium]